MTPTVSFDSNLTEKDCELLLEAIDAYERQPSGDGMIGAMIGMMLTKDEGESKRKMDAAVDKIKFEEGNRKLASLYLSESKQIF